MMPGADEMLADIVTYRLEEIPPITKLISDGKSVEEILELLFDDMDLKIHDSTIPRYKCDCSREKVEKALISIGKEELNNIYKDGKDEEIICQFCGKKYIFTNEDIGKLVEQVIE